MDKIGPDLNQFLCLQIWSENLCTTQCYLVFKNTQEITKIMIWYASFFFLTE